MDKYEQKKQRIKETEINRIIKEYEEKGREIDEIKLQRINKKAERIADRQIRKEKIIKRIGLFLGITTLSIGGVALLTSGEENQPNQPNQPKNENQVDVGKQDEEITFKDGLVVTVDQLNTMNQNEDEIRKSVEEEINRLETSKEVLDYIKNMYVEEYNNTNEEDITKEQLKLNKSRADKEIYEDTATNGDKILRYKTVGGSFLYNQTGVITVDIENDTGKEKEQITKYNNKYQTIYSQYEEVDKYEDNCLINVAEIIDTGIDWAVAMEQDGNSYDVKQEYKNRLIDAVTEYETEKSNENIKQTEQAEGPEL